MGVNLKTPPEASEAPLSNIRRLRLARGLTQEKLAVLSTVSRSWLTFVERNPSELSLATARLLAAVLGCKPEHLFEDRP